MALTLTTATTEDPVTLAQALLHLKQDESGDNDLVTSLITAATRLIEEWTGRQLCTATWTLYLPGFPGASLESGRPDIWLPKPPLSSVTWVKYYDTSNTQQTLSSSLYQTITDGAKGRLRPAVGESWPSTEHERVYPVEVKFVAGYGAASAVPDGLKAAIKLLVAHWYKNREASISGTIIADVPLAVQALAAQYSVGEYGSSSG